MSYQSRAKRITTILCSIRLVILFFGVCLMEMLPAVNRSTPVEQAPASRATGSS